MKVVKIEREVVVSVVVMLHGTENAMDDIARPAMALYGSPSTHTYTYIHTRIHTHTPTCRQAISLGKIAL